MSDRVTISLLLQRYGTATGSGATTRQDPKRRQSSGKTRLLYVPAGSLPLKQRTKATLRIIPDRQKNQAISL
jgi:hypothetical protein